MFWWNRLICPLFFKYDDEYDDTYDEHAVGSEEPDAHTGEDDRRRAFVVPRVLRPKGDDEDEEEEEEEDEGPTNERPRDQFVPNPAELREQAEQRRLARRGHRHPGPSVVGMTFPYFNKPFASPWLNFF